MKSRKSSYNTNKISLDAGYKTSATLVDINSIPVKQSFDREYLFKYLKNLKKNHSDLGIIIMKIEDDKIDFTNKAAEKKLEEKSIRFKNINEYFIYDEFPDIAVFLIRHRFTMILKFYTKEDCSQFVRILRTHLNYNGQSRQVVSVISENDMAVRVPSKQPTINNSFGNFNTALSNTPNSYNSNSLMSAFPMIPILHESVPKSKVADNTKINQLTIREIVKNKDFQQQFDSSTSRSREHIVIPNNFPSHRDYEGRDFYSARQDRRISYDRFDGNKTRMYQDSPDYFSNNSVPRDEFSNYRGNYDRIRNPFKKYREL